MFLDLGTGYKQVHFVCPCDLFAFLCINWKWFHLKFILKEK